MKQDKVIIITALNAYAMPSGLEDGKLVHAYITDNELMDGVAVGNALIDMYRMCASLESAQYVFEKMPEKAVISWTSMITAYSKDGHERTALRLLLDMLRDDVNPDRVSFISVRNAFARLGY